MTTIDELIKTLEAVKKERGNIDVAMWHQDGGGCYNSYTNGITDWTFETNKDGKSVMVLY